MKTHRWKKPWRIASGLLVLIAAAISIWLFQEDEYLRIDSPDGNYTAVVTYRRFESFRPAFPGQSGDKEGFIRIMDKHGVNYGRIRIPMVWMSRDLQWTKNGADLTLVCEWDFKKREYRYWNESQTELIVKRVR